ncbi:MAG: hypothetical protein P8Y51_05215, partial [Campylobacterales bacterium]
MFYLTSIKSGLPLGPAAEANSALAQPAGLCSGGVKKKLFRILVLSRNGVFCQFRRHFVGDFYG